VYAREEHRHIALVMNISSSDYCLHQMTTEFILIVILGFRMRAVVGVEDIDQPEGPKAMDVVSDRRFTTGR